MDGCLSVQLTAAKESVRHCSSLALAVGEHLGRLHCYELGEILPVYHSATKGNVDTRLIRAHERLAHCS